MAVADSNWLHQTQMATHKIRKGPFCHLKRANASYLKQPFGQRKWTGFGKDDKENYRPHEFWKDLGLVTTSNWPQIQGCQKEPAAAAMPRLLGVVAAGYL